MKILLTGATGYIGKRLLPRLIAEGHELFCCVRDRSRFIIRVVIKCLCVNTRPTLDDYLYLATPVTHQVIRDFSNSRLPLDVIFSTRTPEHTRLAISKNYRGAETGVQDATLSRGVPLTQTYRDGIREFLDSETLQELLNRLPEEDAKLVQGYFFEEKTQAVLAQELSYSQTWVCKHLQKICLTLRGMWDRTE